MKRTQIYLTEGERKFFKKKAYKSEKTLSSLIREVLDSHIKNELEIKKRSYGQKKTNNEPICGEIHQNSQK
jgi:hypothetical protein